MVWPAKRRWSEGLGNVVKDAVEIGSLNTVRFNDRPSEYMSDEERKRREMHRASQYHQQIRRRLFG